LSLRTRSPDTGSEDAQVKPPPEECERRYTMLWYGAQVVLKDNDADPEKETVVKVNYELSERIED
jgi:hypothetical protein